MNRLLPWLVAVVIAGRALAAPAVHRVYEQTPLGTALLDLARAASRDVVLGDEVRGLVTSRLAGVPPDRAFRDLVKSHGLVIREVGTLWVVGAPRLLDLPGRLDAFDREARLRETRVTLDVAAIHLPDLVKLLMREAELSWVVNPPVGSRFWAHLERQPLSAVLAALGLAMGLAWEVRDGTILFFPPPSSRPSPSR